MSTTPETEFDLEKLFLPSWAQEAPNVNKYASFKGEERESRGSDRPGGRRPPRRDGGGQGPSRGPRPGGPGGTQGRGDGFGDSRRRQEGSSHADQPAERREPPPPPPQIDLTILPDEKGTEFLARQIKITGRAYPLFDIAHLILQKPERQQVRFDVVKKKSGEVEQPLYLCALDESLWLSLNDAVEHILSKHFDTFYQSERTQTDPPKGTYTFVAQCGISGVILGPPNHHDYQNQLRKLHAERFARMPFEAFKARIKIVKDEAIVKKWIEDQSFKTEYVCLNIPDATKLASREEVEKHFREVHLPNIVKQVETCTVSGAAARLLRCPALQRLMRSALEDQRRFPLRLATTLSQQFANHGLQFFKVNRTVTHVSVARPHFLDLEATPVSEGVKRIVDFVNATSKCTRRKLIEALVSKSAATPAPKPAAPVTPTASPSADGPTASAPAEAPVQETSPELNALNADLHWLIHQGHVIEFANGLLETAKRPLPKPTKPEPKPAAAPKVAPALESAASEAPASAALAEAAAHSALPQPETLAVEPAKESVAQTDAPLAPAPAESQGQVSPPPDPAV